MQFAIVLYPSRPSLLKVASNSYCIEDNKPIEMWMREKKIRSVYNICYYRNDKTLHLHQFLFKLLLLLIIFVELTEHK